jgi:DNA-binding NarL/FixJ family response regulator
VKSNLHTTIFKNQTIFARKTDFAYSELINMSIHVAIVEDHDDIREGLSALIDGAEGFRCVAAYSCAEATLEELPQLEPDVVLMDIGLPGMSGIECIPILKAQHPQMQIMMLTIYEDDDKIFNSLKAGATGYILKKTPPDKLLEAIRDLHNGGSPMSPQIACKVVQAFQQNHKPSSLVSDGQAKTLEILTAGLDYFCVIDF